MKTIKIDGLDKPIRFNFNALCEFEDITGIPFMEGIASLDLRGMRALIYVGLKSGAQQDGKPFEYTIDQVGEWLQVDTKLMEEVAIILAESLPQGKPGKTGAKKKL